MSTLLETGKEEDQEGKILQCEYEPESAEDASDAENDGGF